VILLPLVFPGLPYLAISWTCKNCIDLTLVLSKSLIGLPNEMKTHFSLSHGLSDKDFYECNMEMRHFNLSHAFIAPKALPLESNWLACKATHKVTHVKNLHEISHGCQIHKAFYTRN